MPDARELPNVADGLGEAIVSIRELEDGRYAVQNHRSMANLDAQQLYGMLQAFRGWWELMWDMHGDTDADL